MPEKVKLEFKGKVVVLGIGNTLRSDDGAGSILAGRIKAGVPFVVFDAGMSPENYLEMAIKEEPDTVILIDAVDFGGMPGEFRFYGAEDIKTINLFSTHNVSVSLLINYLQTNLKADIIILLIQPKSIELGEALSPEIAKTLEKLENWFYEAGKEKG